MITSHPVMQSILIPVDGSDEAREAARYAGRLAALSGGATTLLYVYDSKEIAALGVVVWESDSVAQIEREAKDAAFARAVSALAESGRTPSNKVALVGDPADQILAYAREHSIDLIVMGSRPHSAVRALLGGSTGEKVLKGATCPVLFVHAH